MRHIVSLAVLPVLAAGADLTQADWSKLTANARPTPLLQRHGTLCANCHSHCQWTTHGPH